MCTRNPTDPPTPLVSSCASAYRSRTCTPSASTCELARAGRRHPARDADLAPAVRAVSSSGDTPGVESLSVTVAGACRRQRAVSSSMSAVSTASVRASAGPSNRPAASSELDAPTSPATCHASESSRPGELQVDVAHELVVAAEGIARHLQVGERVRPAEPVEPRREPPESRPLEHEPVHDQRAARLERVEAAAHAAGRRTRRRPGCARRPRCRA